MEKKYKLTGETLVHECRTLHRIEALRDFGDVKKGDKGGWIESEANLSHYDNCWIYDNAKAFGYSEVLGDAQVFGDSIVCEYSIAYGNANISGDTRISGNTRVSGIVGGKSNIYGEAWILGWVYDSEVCDVVILNDTHISGAEVESDDGYMVFIDPVTHMDVTWTKSNDWWANEHISMSSDDFINKYGAQYPKFLRDFKDIVYNAHTMSL